MQIAKNTLAKIDYTLTDPEGKIIDSSKGRQPLAYLHGASLRVTDPQFKAIDLICDLVEQAGDKAQFADLEAISRRATIQ